MSNLQDAEIVIIGGGAVGCGVAFSLAEAGKTDIVLVEKAGDLGEATTSQGAGLCGQVRSTPERTRLAMHSAATFTRLQRDSEVKPDWHAVGSLRLALTEKAAAQFAKLQAKAGEAGLETAMLGPAEAKKLWPPMDMRGVKAALWCPTDGYMTPRSVVKAYEHQCRRKGVRFASATAVESIALKDDRVEAVQTSRGTIRCRLAINAAGAHAYHIAKLVGLELPIVPVRHEYFVSMPIAGLSPELPCFRIPELALYGRVADHGLLLGGWETKSLHADPRRYALAATPPAIEPDHAVLDGFAERFAALFPEAESAGAARIAKGWPTFTPDGRFIIGESSRVPGFVMAGGCNAHGISGSAGIGRLLVESLFDPSPSAYVKSLSPDRFMGGRWDWESATREAQRVYETYYALESC